MNIVSYGMFEKYNADYFIGFLRLLQKFNKDYHSP